MNTLKDTSNMSKQKPSLKKEELEKIAAELKKKLSKASLTAKQSLSPTNIRTNSSPLKSYFTPSKNITSSPNLYSPSSKSPTKMNPTYLVSPPIHEDSPTKKRKTLPLKGGPQMVLEEIPRPNTPTKQTTLKPSLDDKVTTPTLAKKELHDSALLKTPKSKSNNYNDNEGADLLMFLATSPSPAKPYYTPKHSLPSRDSKFVQPAPPVTPKRHLQANTKTPNNRLTPGFNLFNGGMPSHGLTLTPTGFNMNDYVNFFSPSPGGEMLQKNLLKTPDFSNLERERNRERD